MSIGDVASADWLARHHERSDLVVLDATVLLASPGHDGDFRARSGRSAWLAARIPGSRHADLLGDLSDQTSTHHFARLHPDLLAQRLGHLGVGAGDLVVCYDRDGSIWAARLWWMLRDIGIEAKLLDGGWDGWLAFGGAVESGPAPSVVPRSCPVLAERGGWVDRSQVEDIVGGRRDAQLVCALGERAFRGEVPTRYARRGHIPGSRSLPARGVIDDHGRFRSAADLRELCAALLVGPLPPALYCGGGIAASLLAFVLVQLGRSDVAVYDGSLDEWSADPSLPLTSTSEQLLS